MHNIIMVEVAKGEQEGIHRGDTEVHSEATRLHQTGTEDLFFR